MNSMFKKRDESINSSDHIANKRNKNLFTNIENNIKLNTDNTFRYAKNYETMQKVTHGYYKCLKKTSDNKNCFTSYKDDELDEHIPREIHDYHVTVQDLTEVNDIEVDTWPYKLCNNKVVRRNVDTIVFDDNNGHIDKLVGEPNMLFPNTKI